MPIILPSGGTGSGTLAPIFNSTLAVDTAALDTLAVIPVTGTVLEVFALLRTDDAGATANVNINLNNDTSGVYQREQITGANVTAAAGPSVVDTKWLIAAHGSGGAASVFSVVRFSMVGYASTTPKKTVELTWSTPDTTAANEIVGVLAAVWENTAAVTRVAFSGVGAAKLKAGSTLVVYVR